MNPARLAIKRPIFISSIVAIIVILGGISYSRIGLELIPDVTFPIISVSTIYPGASPAEVESLVTKPLEDELAAIAGVKHINSENTEGYSAITLEFNMDVDVEKVAQDVRDKVSVARNSLPDDLDDDPVVQKYDPDSTPVMKLALISSLPPAQIYDLAKEKIKPRIARIKDVGTVSITGGNRREIQVEIDHDKMNEYRMSMINLVSKIENSGANVSIGRQEHGSTQTVFRSMGDFTSLEQIGNTLLSFSGDVGNSVSINTIGRVRDGLEDITSAGYIYSPEQKEKKETANKNSNRDVQSCVYLNIIKQSGTNTVKVCDSIKKKIEEINKSMAQTGGNSKLIVTLDQSKWIRTNIDETVTSILVGILLAVMVVFLFLGNVRSTVITAIAIPNSLLGAVIVMNFMGYTFNVMTLMALSLVVGLLVDDAIVVRENIFRKLEAKMDSHKAAELGTTEVMLAVIATTMAIISVFFPIGMLSGVIGKLFKQFGYTVIFAMLVSLFDALTVAPFLSAYFAGDGKKSDMKLIVWFEKFQDRLEVIYEKIMKVCLSHPLMVVLATVLIFLTSIILLGQVKKTFFPVGDRGEFTINVEMPAGTSLQGTMDTLRKIEKDIRNLPDMDYYGVTAGTSTGDVTRGTIDCFLKSDRQKDTQENKKIVRKILKKYAFAFPSVDDPGSSRRGSPFVLIVSGNDLASVEENAVKIIDRIKDIPDLIDLDSSMKTGKPEFRIIFNDRQMQNLGVSSTTAGVEMRYNVTGAVVGLFKEGGYNYDIRARLKPDQRDVQKLFYTMKVPNATGNMVKLSSIARGEYTKGSAQINRRDKAYIVKITANISPDSGVGTAMEKVEKAIKAGVKLPPSVAYSFSGQSENFAETASSVLFALVIAIVFIYLVLSSLYESFVTPYTILMAIPPALTGALFSLFITGFMMDIFSMIGMVMLIGLVTKNSILLVDNAVHNLTEGMDRKEAILRAGIRRLRPILMTTFAMLAGMLPLAMGIGEAAKFRQSMGIAIMGGIILSTLVTLIVVPAVFEYIDRFRAATEARIIVRRKKEPWGEKVAETVPLKEAEEKKPAAAKKRTRKKN